MIRRPSGFALAQQAAARRKRRAAARGRAP